MSHGEDVIQEAVQATIRMLEWRRLDWVPAKDEWCADPSLQSILSSEGLQGNILVAPSEALLFVVTNISRIGMPQLKAVMDNLEGWGIRQLHLVACYPLTTQQQNLAIFQDRMRIIPWNLVLMYPLDHQLVPAHRRATADDLQLLPAGALKRRSQGIF